MPGLLSVAMALDFPGPLILTSYGQSTCSLATPSYVGAKQILLIGSLEGQLGLFDFIPGADAFTSVGELLVEGEFVNLAPWDRYGGSGFGVVAVLANPDALAFFSTHPDAPRIRLVATHLLEEDPGPLVSVNNEGIQPLDLAISLPGIDQLVIFRHDGESWYLAQTIPAGDDPASLTVFDVDGDGRMELLSGDRGPLSGTVSIYRISDSGVWWRDGQLEVAGQASAVATYQSGEGATPQLLVSLSDRPGLVVYEEAGGLLTYRSELDLGVSVENMNQVALADGPAGLICWDTVRGLVEYFRDMGGGLARVETYYSGCRPWNFAPCDFNGDGNADLVFQGSSAGINSVLFADAQQAFWGFQAIALWSTPGSASLADFNGDTQQDLVVTSLETDGISLFLGRSAGLLSQDSYDQTLGFQPGAMAIISFSDDQAPGLAVWNSDSRALHVMEYLPAQGFVPLSTLNVGKNPRHLVSGDCDGDGFQDLVASFGTGNEVRVFFGAGDGTFLVQAQQSIDWGLVRLALVDLDGNGGLDVVGIDGISRIWSLVLNEDRTFGAVSWVNTGTMPSSLAASDLDGDLDLDVITGNIGSDSLSFLENNGSGALALRIGNLSLEGTPSGIEIGDVNSDGLADVVVGFATEGNVGLAVAEAEWSYPMVQRFAGGLQSGMVMLHDFNQDGLADVFSLDRSLQLGMTMLNVERVIVAVHPTALTAECRDGIIVCHILPDRPGSWSLLLRTDGDVLTLARDGQALVGTIEFSFDQWIWRHDAAELLMEGTEQLQLVVGLGGDQESLTMAVPEDCSAGGPPDAVPLLAWSEDPHPNPFNPSVRARFTLGLPGNVTAAVFDLKGRLVQEIFQQSYPAGTHEVVWRGQWGSAPAPAGVYFLQVASPQGVLSRKILLLK